MSFFQTRFQTIVSNAILIRPRSRVDSGVFPEDHQDVLRGVVVPRFEAMTAFTLTKRDNESPSMARSADSAIEAKTR